MYYGRGSTNRKKAKRAAKARIIFHTVVMAFVRAGIICMLVGIFYAGKTVYGMYLDVLSGLPDADTIDISPTGYQTHIYDSDGNEIETLVASGANREYVDIDHIPKNLQNAFVAVEDERFWEHNGIDWQSIVRAGVTGISNGMNFTQGGSTITQQLLKNNYFTTWTEEGNDFKKKLVRKLQEQYLAVQLEKVTSKEEILENYLNTINLGQNCLGVQSAALRYFGKDVSELTISECAVIAGITKNPTGYNPITHADKNSERRQIVLDDMLSQGYITESQYKTAMADNVYDRIQVVNTEISTSSNAQSYFVDELTDEIMKDLMEQKGYTSQEAYNLLYTGGLRVFSTQDSRIQQICDEEVANPDNYAVTTKYSFSYRLTIEKADGSFKNYSEQTMLYYYQSSNKDYNINFASIEDCDAAIAAYKEAIMEPGDKIAEAGETLTYTLQPQVAFTVIDQSNGHVVAMIGGRGDKENSKTLNRAVDTTRQPGSTFKILSTYAPGIDTGAITLATTQEDAQTFYSGGDEAPEVNNVDFRWRGFTSARDGIINSINTVAVRNIQTIGVGLAFDYLQNFGFTTLVSGDCNEAIALGGITYGVNNLELTAAYAAIANGGVYIKPSMYTMVTDGAGNVILDNTGAPSGKRVIKETTSWLITSAMQDVMTKGTGTRANFQGMATAGKSGTTNGERDTIFAGFTPYYTMALWGGFDDNSEQHSVTYSKNIWREVMKRIHEPLEYRDFEKPEGIVEATVCAESGKLMVPGLCDADPRGNMLKTEFFTEDTVPTEYCDRHVMASTCGASGLLANSGCPIVSGIYIGGASEGTEEAAWRLPTAYCPFHEGVPNPINFFSGLAVGTDGVTVEGGGFTATDLYSLYGLYGYSDPMEFYTYLTTPHDPIVNPNDPNAVTDPNAVPAPDPNAVPQ